MQHNHRKWLTVAGYAVLAIHHVRKQALFVNAFSVDSIASTLNTTVALAHLNMQFITSDINWQAQQGTTKAAYQIAEL